MKLGSTLPQHRPHNYGTSLGCGNCIFNATCGGLTNSSPLFDCFEQYCCEKSDCDNVCPHNQNFIFRYSEVGGFTIKDLPKLQQVESHLPNYIPMIHHGSSRENLLEAPHVAVSLYSLFTRKDAALVPKFDSTGAIRNHFRISQSAEIMLCGTGKDKSLEKYWSHRRVDQLVEYLGTLNISMVIGPNYSSFLNVPRTDIQFNRKRQFLCLTELNRESISAVPHISVTMPGDWSIWTEYLKANPEIRYVAFNFQTGFKSPHQGRHAIRCLAKMRDQIGRELVPLLIGGTQFNADCSLFFDKFTVVDSVPFSKTIKRYAMTENLSKREWAKHPTSTGEPLDALLKANIDCYSKWVHSNRSSLYKKSA